MDVMTRAVTFLNKAWLGAYNACITSCHAYTCMCQYVYDSLHIWFLAKCCRSVYVPPLNIVDSKYILFPLPIGSVLATLLGKFRQCSRWIHSTWHLYNPLALTRAQCLNTNFKQSKSCWNGMCFFAHVWRYTRSSMKRLGTITKKDEFILGV